MSFERVLLAVLTVAVLFGVYVMTTEMGKSELEKEIARCEKKSDNPYDHRVLFCKDDVYNRYEMDW